MSVIEDDEGPDRAVRAASDARPFRSIPTRDARARLRKADVESRPGPVVELGQRSRPRPRWGTPRRTPARSTPTGIGLEMSSRRTPRPTSRLPTMPLREGPSPAMNWASDSCVSDCESEWDPPRSPGTAARNELEAPASCRASYPDRRFRHPTNPRSPRDTVEITGPARGSRGRISRPANEMRKPGRFDVERHCRRRVTAIRSGELIWETGACSTKQGSARDERRDTDRKLLCEVRAGDGEARKCVAREAA